MICVRPASLVVFETVEARRRMDVEHVLIIFVAVLAAIRSGRCGEGRQVVKDAWVDARRTVGEG